MDTRHYRVTPNYDHVVVHDRRDNTALLLVRLNGLRDVPDSIRKFALEGIAQLIRDKLTISWELMIKRLLEVEGITIQEA